MKDGFLLFAFTLFWIIASYAQNPAETARFGLKGMGSFNSIVGGEAGTSDIKIGYQGGVLAEIPINERLSIQPEVLYSSRGFYGKGKAIGTTRNVEYILDYFQMPILAKYYLVDGLSLQAGPQIAFRLNEEVKAGGGRSFSSSENFINLGVVAGLGYKFQSGFFIQGHFNYGISNVLKEIKGHHFGLSLGVGIMLNFEGRECYCPY